MNESWRKPWSWDGQFPAHIKDADGYIICDMYPRAALDLAHKVAAAPDLLEAAKSVIEWDASRPRYFGHADAPGHAHSRPGVWDDDNGALAGKQCQWCGAWASLRAAIAKAEGR